MTGASASHDPALFDSKSSDFGRAFRRASEDDVRAAVQRIEPPTQSNIIAMAALAHGRGLYERWQIAHTLTNSYTALRAAVLESPSLGGDEAEVIIHTGWWGCGAFGGNRHLMAIVQVLAAQMAGVDRMIFHTVDEGALGIFDEAMEQVSKLCPQGESIGAEDAIDAILRGGFRWKKGNGT